MTIHFFWMSAGVAVNVGRYRVFLPALGLAVPQASLAVSHFAFRLVDAALGVVWQCAGRLAMPRLCALQGDREAMAEAYGDIAQLQALLGLPVCAGIALVAPDLVAVLLALGRLALAEQLWGKAQSYLEASLSVAPSSAAHLALARLLERKGNQEAAYAHYRQSLELALRDAD